jgi:hypothetical protein
MERNNGKCQCGAISYSVEGEPLITTICYCKFCQKATGSAYAIEPIFPKENMTVKGGTPKTYVHVSDGSGSKFYVHFCAQCGTKVFITFDRWPDQIAIYGGMFDDPDWFEMRPDNMQHIYVGSARKGTVIPANFRTYDAHAFTNEGIAIKPTIYSEPKLIE